jgi:hypothetical protein
MSKLERFFGKPKQIEINGEMLTIKPLTVEDLPLIMALGKEGENDAVQRLIHKTLKEAVPDATDEEINKVSFEHFEKLMNAIMEVNNLKMDESKRKILEMIKK